MASSCYPMRVVSQRTGLSPHVLRVWERRYRAIEPERTATNRRLYTEEEVGRLELLASLTRGGHSIGQIAGLPLNELRDLAAKLPALTPQRPSPTASPGTAEERDDFLEEAWNHVTNLDARGLGDTLEAATLAMGISITTQDLIVPLIGMIGTGWQNSRISIAEEHAASAVIKEYLILNSRPFAESASAPCLIVTTPPGQLHDLGAVLVTHLARRMGWNVSYLGPSLPAEEIARAARRSEAIAVALSIVYPADDPQLPAELRRLRRFLPTATPLLVGGRSAVAYQTVLTEIGATLITNLPDLSSELESLRSKRLVTEQNPHENPTADSFHQPHPQGAQ